MEIVGLAFALLSGCVHYSISDESTLGDEGTLPAGSTSGNGDPVVFTGSNGTTAVSSGSPGTVPGGGTSASSSSSSGGAADASAEPPNVAALSAGCKPLNFRPLAGWGWLLVESPLHLGAIEFNGDELANTIVVAGTGRANEVAVSDGSALPDVVFRCVTALSITANGGNDRITIGRPTPNFVNVGPIVAIGGAGSNNIGINNSTGVVGGVSLR